VSGQCQCPPPLQRDAPRGEHGMPGRPAIRAPPVKTHGPTRCRSPARTHAGLQQARGQAGPFWTDPACQRRPRRRGVCVPRRQSTAHSHAQQLRVRSGQRTHRVWLCAITRKKTARARRGRNAHMHVAGRLPPCAPVWNDGTNARGARHPPQKQHTRWQPSSLRASRPRPARPRRRRARPRRRCARPRRRVAAASPLPVVAQMLSESNFVWPKMLKNVGRTTPGERPEWIRVPKVFLRSPGNRFFSNKKRRLKLSRLFETDRFHPV
jgi:hypothetical protein